MSTMSKNHNSSFSEGEKVLLNIIKSLQKELIECKKDLLQKEAQLDEAVSQLHDLLSWGRSLVSGSMFNDIMHDGNCPGPTDGAVSVHG